MIFSAYGPTVLDRREREGVRGIVSERNRWSLHISSAPFFEMPLEEIRSTHVRAWIHTMQEKKANDTRGDRLLSSQTIARAKALVSAIMARAVEEELCQGNPCRGVELRKRAEEIAAPEPWTFLNPEEQHAFASCPRIQPHHRTAIMFAIGTGARQGEQASLHISDVHAYVPRPHIVIRFGGKKFLPPKNGKKRTVPLFGHGLVAAREALAWVQTQHNPLGLLFPDEKGRVCGVGKFLGRERDDHGRWRDAWALAKERVGLKRRCRWHDLRHTAGSSLVAGWWGRRWTLEEVRPFLGHSSILITQRYAHIGDEALHAAAAETGVALIPDADETLRDLCAPEECDDAAA
jgi:integrase